MPKPRIIELLAPAKDLSCGMAAIDSGADAVYIGAEHFGARAAAGNAVEDIAALCEYAHTFRARVYVTVNTIIYNDELQELKTLLQRLAEARVDAVLVQDMAVVALAKQLADEGISMPQLHASTQTDNRDAEQVAWLAQQGFSRVVLARELSVDDIQQIHEQVPDVVLEAFVHGALCVSYSGACYASQHCFQRSANRGECAQFCRLRFSLVDADGKMLVHDRYLLSLKDMCRIASLEEIIKAGVTSLKIEGRLKEADYVKNVVAAYSQRLNDIIQNNPGTYQRASLGKCEYAFVPDLHKSFNRGFTDYFLHGRKTNIAAMDSPKAIGEPVGKVKAMGDRWITVAGTARFANGDGLCYFDDKRQLVGFRVNKVENNKLFPLQMPQGLKRGTALYRNYDKAFVQTLAKPQSAIRKMAVEWRMEYDNNALTLAMTLVETGESVYSSLQIALSEADKPQRDLMMSQLKKLGNTPFVAIKTEIDDVQQLFIPTSVIAELRRKACESMMQLLSSPLTSHLSPLTPHNSSLVTHNSSLVTHNSSLIKNVANNVAKEYYQQQGTCHMTDAVEVNDNSNGSSQPLRIMECKHCLRFALHHCVRRGQPAPEWREPLSLVLPDKRRFKLNFDCGKCQMNVYAEH